MPLFKYLHPDRTDVLRSQSIRFSSPAVLNDPFELKPHIAALASREYAAAELRRLLPNILEEELSKFPDELRQLIPASALEAFVQSQLPATQAAMENAAASLVPKLQETMARKFEEILGILCLSESPASLLMWAHYADSHKGFVLQFDERSAFFDRRVNPSDEFRHLRKVTYSCTRPSLTLAEVQDFSPFMTKGLDWQYEAEWRMLAPLESASRTIGSGPEAIHLFEFPATAVTAVMLGARMTDSKREEVRQILSEPRYSHITCIDAWIDDEHYLVRVQPNDT